MPARPARRRPATPPWCPTRCSAEAARRQPYLRRHAAPPCRARTCAGDTHLPRVCASACHVRRCPTTGTGDALRVNACVAARLPAGLLRGMRPHRARGSAAGTRPKRLGRTAGAARSVPAGATARCHCPGPGSRPRSAPTRRTLGTAARPAARVGGRCAGSTAERARAGTHCRDRVHGRHGCRRPLVRAFTPAGRRTPRPSGGRPHPCSLAAQAGHLRGVVANGHGAPPHSRQSRQARALTGQRSAPMIRSITTTRQGSSNCHRSSAGRKRVLVPCRRGLPVRGPEVQEGA
jgi:hypothetical protein